MTAATTRKPKKSDSIPAELPDFKTLAAETRAKLSGAPKPRSLVTRGPSPTEAVIAPQAGIIPGTLGILYVPLSQTVRSGCNVRHHYDPVAIEELAASLASQGQLENATGRWNESGQVEIVAGESRRRAQLLRVERGEIDADFPFLVQIRELNDGDALAISATENMRRRSMTGLEECEAMLRLQEAGRTPEAISAMFGYKTVQPVVERILVAKNLHTTGRDLLDKGELSLAQAFVIARVPGNDLQLSMTSNATSRHNPASARQLAEQLSRGQFLVSTAKFKVEDSGLEVKRDLFDVYEPFFEDKSKALDAQIAWAKARAKRIKEAGKRAFAHVITGSSYSFSTYDHKQYEYAHESDKAAGTVLYIRSETGELKEEKSVKLKGKTVSSAPSGQAATVREMPVSAYLEAHQLRAVAARSAVVGNTHLTLALTVWGLILGSSDTLGRVNLGSLSGTGMPEFIPEELRVRRAALVELLNPLTSTGKDAHLAGISSGLSPDRQKLLELLIGLTDDELLGHLNTLTAMTAYDWSAYQDKAPTLPEYLYLAGLTDAPQRLASAFTLTNEHLKRYPRHELVALAEEAGLGRALVEDCSTLKEMRARILEHAERLHAEGFVPALVRFPKATG